MQPVIRAAVYVLAALQWTASYRRIMCTLCSIRMRRNLPRVSANGRESRLEGERICSDAGIHPCCMTYVETCLR